MLGFERFYANNDWKTNFFNYVFPYFEQIKGDLVPAWNLGMSAGHLEKMTQKKNTLINQFFTKLEGTNPVRTQLQASSKEKKKKVKKNIISEMIKKMEEKPSKLKAEDPLEEKKLREKKKTPRR
jgi:hypothetical protein